MDRTVPGSERETDSNMKQRFKHQCEYVLLLGVVAVVRALPYRAALFVGYLIAWFSFHVLRFRVRLAAERVREVFGDQVSGREVRRITWLSWRNFVFCAIDLIRLPLISKGWIRSHAADHEEAARKMLENLKDGKGAVLACPHMGAWEVAGAAMQFSGVPIFFITGRQTNPFVDAYLNRLRGSTGIATVQRGSSLLRGVMGRLRQGQVLGFLPDVRKGSKGVSVQFLGKTANAVEGMAFFARKAGAPIVTLIATRRGWSGHHIRLCAPVLSDRTLSKRDDWQRMLQAVFADIEKAIRDEPEQWFWFNKRWILDPLGR